MSSNIMNTTFKTPLLNDCTKHLAFQFKKYCAEGKPQPKKTNPLYEAPLIDTVTHEFVRGYN